MEHTPPVGWLKLTLMGHTSSSANEQLHTHTPSKMPCLFYFIPRGIMGVNVCVCGGVGGVCMHTWVLYWWWLGWGLGRGKASYPHQG